MAKQLSQEDIDALLNAVGSKPDASAQAGGGPAEEEAQALQPGWDAVGEDLATVLASALAAAWRRRVPVMSVVRADALPTGFDPRRAFRVVRLGHPLTQRIWFFWDAPGEAGADAAEGFVDEIEALLPTSMHRQVLETQVDFPADGVLLPYRGVTPGDSIPLTLGLGGGPQLRQLRERLRPSGPVAAGHAPRAAAAPPAAAGPANDQVHAELEGVEVEASVFVGGAHYPLSELAGLRPGSVLTLGFPSEPAVVAVNGRVVALGEVVVLADDTLGIRLSQITLDEDAKRAATPSWMR